LSNLLSDVRCNMQDAQLAVETGVDGLDVVIGTSSFLREHSHGKDMDYITKTALEVIAYIKSKGLEVRCEFMSSIPSALIRITHAIPKPPAASCTLEFRLGIYSSKRQ
jgi:homocitrate synthase